MVLAHIAVWAEIPMMRAGVASVLSTAGYRVESPTDLQDWALSRAVNGESAAVVASIHSGFAPPMLATLPASIPVVVLQPGCAPSVLLAALAAGASCIVRWDCDDETLLLAVQAALVGLAVVPASALRRLVPLVGQWKATDEETICLRRLAAGETVASLARDLHYSEREMFRRLKNMYPRLGVSRRQDALVRAIELGIVDFASIDSGQLVMRTVAEA